MTVSNPITSFGVHQIAIEDRSTHARFGAWVLGDFSFENKQEQIELRGGSSPYPWDAAPADSDASVKMEFKQYDLNLLKYLNGFNSSVPNYTEDADGEAAGAATDLTNLIGTSVYKATTGVASVAPKSSQNPVFGNYLLKAVSATTVDVYLDNNLDGLAFVDDTLKITSSPITIPGTGGTVDIPNANITITGGSGTIAMTTGDIASFNARPINNYLYEYKGGAPGAPKPDFALTVFTERVSAGLYRAFYFPRVKANGVGFKNPRKEWAGFDADIKVLYDSALGYAFKSLVVGRS